MLRHLVCGTGPALSGDVVRGAMLLRQCLGQRVLGGAANRNRTINRAAQCRHRSIVPGYGSVGASGDLIPSAYSASAVLGEGRVVYRGEGMRATDTLALGGIGPIELQPKEGLALVNGTTVMTSLAGLALFDTAYLARLCVAAVAMSVEHR